MRTEILKSIEREQVEIPLNELSSETALVVKKGRDAYKKEKFNEFVSLEECFN